MTVAELSKRITNAELNRWKMYNQKKPFGSDRDNFHAAQICSVIANVNRGKGQAAFKVSDFMYKDSGTVNKSNIAKTMAAFNSRAIKNGN